MPRFFINESPSQQAIITGEDSKHITKSLRMKVGESLVLCNGQGMDYHCTISSMDEHQVVVSVNSSVPTISEPSVSVTLYQGLPKSDKMDSVVQKAVEMGVTRIVPVLTQRCVSRPDQKSAQKKVERWQKISVEAAKQCGRGILPPVSPVTDFSAALRQAASESTILFFYEGGGQSLHQCIDPSCKSYSIFIGPEGGFAEEEVQLALDSGVKKATLGPRILRTETAPVAALAAIMLTTGNMT
ncbi:MAG: 16S rRNA (uracil(1498)-N(3))-methyltransferase [Acutalibacteraceae bacterium]|nr:16S rRNA (uracil(1498)-N(3))-methyltransferase [Acutalibacteraceae bacterium]